MACEIDRLGKSRNGKRVFFIASCLNEKEADELIEKLRKLMEESK